MLETVVLILKVLWALTKATYRYAVPKSKKPVKGEIVLITGAGQGIGRETALVYASEGATVVCVDVNENCNRETAQKIFELGWGKAFAYTCDVSNYSNVEQLTRQVEKEVGTVTVLINNAGTLMCNEFCKFSEAEIRRMVDVNFMAHLWTIKAILPSMMKKNHGHIVGVASIGTIIPSPFLLPYSASKFAIQGLMESLQNELSLYKNCKIKTTTVHPCVIDTPMMRNSNIKYCPSFPVYSATDVARCIIDSQRRDVVETTAPVGLYLTLRSFLKMTPIEVVPLICNHYKYTLIDQPVINENKNDGS